MKKKWLFLLFFVCSAVIIAFVYIIFFGNKEIRDLQTDSVYKLNYPASSRKNTKVASYKNFTTGEQEAGFLVIWLGTNDSPAEVVNYYRQNARIQKAAADPALTEEQCFQKVESEMDVWIYERSNLNNSNIGCYLIYWNEASQNYISISISPRPKNYNSARLHTNK